jgi:hypothetical protein
LRGSVLGGGLGWSGVAHGKVLGSAGVNEPPTAGKHILPNRPAAR